jgi:Ulp1 family protease
MWLDKEQDLPWLDAARSPAVETLSPVQGNGFDCGVYTILAAACEAMDIPLNTLPWGQQHAECIRTQLAALLLES